MILGLLLLLAGLTISAVAIYYSVLGLAAIFAAATIPIYIMGGVLEVSKLVVASWLKANWTRATGFIKWYMSLAVVILMMITSMGIFGFLSKAHIDQGVPTGDVQAQISLIDERIANERNNIQVARETLAQLDRQVNETLNRTAKQENNAGVNRSINIRRQQAKERASLQKEIETATANIRKLNEEKIPIASQLRKVEAEVGPIKYIAQFIYGQEADQNLLEKAVTWVIILIVFVFDPLAIAMLLAAQMTFGWYRKDKEQNRVEPPLETVTESPAEEIKPDAWVADVGEKPTAEELAPEEPAPHHPDTHPYLRKGFVFPEGWKSEPPLVYNPEKEFEESKWPSLDPEKDSEAENIPPVTADTTEVKTTDSQFQILPELVEESSKKKIHDQESGTTNSQNEEVVYIQNNEQTASSLWKRIKEQESEEIKAKDYLRFVYSKNGFEDFQYDPDLEPELDKFIKDIKTGEHSFSDYTSRDLKLFASKIYELRKN